MTVTCDRVVLPLSTVFVVLMVNVVTVSEMTVIVLVGAYDVLVVVDHSDVSTSVTVVVGRSGALFSRAAFSSNQARLSAMKASL